LTAIASGRSVLVVDDDRDFGDSLVDLITSDGVRAHCARSADEAYRALECGDWDVVLVDVRLGAEDGMDLIAAFRRRWPERIYVAMTAYASIEFALQALKQGAYDFLRKPFHPDELAATLARAFERLALEREQRDSGRRLAESERRFRDITEGSVQGVYIHRDWKPLYVNPAFARILGFESVEALLARGSLEHHVAPGERERVLSVALECVHNASASEHYGYEAVRQDGERVWLQGFARAVVWDDAPAVQCAVVDVTDERRALRRLRLHEQIISSTADLMAFVRPDGRIEAVNEAWARAFGRRLEDCVSQAVGSMHPDLGAGSLFDDAFRACSGGQQAHVKTWLEMPGGQRRFMDIVLYPYHGSSEDERGVVLAWRDLTETRDLSDKLSFQASHDSLTGVWNRRAFEEKLAAAVEEAALDGVTHAVCYLDLDQFKVVNDTCGHLAGDELLRQIGALLPRRVRRDDVFARLGGDEFAVLMRECSITQAVGAAEKLLEAIAEFRFSWEDNSFAISASVGLVPIDRHAESVSTVMSRADRACYAAKESGRNRLHVYRADDEHLVRRHGEMRWVTRLTQALVESRFELWAQQITPIECSQGDGGHHEILLRMRDDAGAVVPPGAFLPAAERYQLATRIDEWVFNAVLDWAEARRERLSGVERLFINLSGQSLADNALLERMVSRLRAGGVPGALLGFEVTETAAIANLAQAERFICALREQGAHFALDDFGSGLSSFGYLKTLAVDYLKIDGMFVKDILRDPIDLAMVRSINEIGHIMGKRTVAEFVENEAILERLREIGVDFVQGYHIGMPARLDEVIALAPLRRLTRSAG
jgi:Amt family ammonium transporter